MHPNSQIKIPFVAFSPQIDKNRNLKYFLPNKVIPIKKPKNQIKISYISYAYYSIAIYCIKIHFKKIEEYRPMRPCSHYKKLHKPWFLISYFYNMHWNFSWRLLSSSPKRHNPFTVYGEPPEKHQRPYTHHTKVKNMKKFNVKVLSMAVTAAVASGAAGAAEQNFAAAVGGKDDQGQAAFFTVFGEGTTYDKDTGKLTFKKDSDALLLKTLELEQTINGFASGSNFITTDANGNKTVREATNEDVEADEFKGLGLKEVVAAHDEALGDLTETVNENSEALVKTAEVVNTISADVNANKAAIETNKTAIATKADKADVDKLVEYTADMGKKVNDIGDTVTELGDSTKEAIAAVEKDIDANKQDIVGLTKGLGLAAEAVEDNRKEIDVNKAAIDANKEAIATKADKADVDELVKYTADMGKKVNDIGDAVTELGDSTKEAIAALEEDIDSNKTAIENKADKKDVEGIRIKAIEAKELAQSVQGSVEVAKKSAKTAADSAQAAQKAADANAAQVETNKADIVTLQTASNQHATDIATLQTASNQHAAGIAKNSARIDSLDKNVANLRKETRQGLAAQAALSGLFQPYSVGKFNVTAALGGFKSDTAVAVGAGYRFNENFAAKAGLAVGTSSGGSASYNVGLNYEW